MIAVLISLLTLAYFLSMQRKVFFGKVPAGFAQVEEAGSGLLLPAVALSVITVGLGLIFPLALNFILR